MGAALTRGVQIGNLLIEDRIGEGGMGVVYRARHVVIGKRVAVKVIAPDAARDREAVQRFIREAQLASELNHRNIPDVHDAGQLADGRWYLSMDYLDGAPLARLMRSTGPMEPVQIVQVMCQIANALQKAHGKGILHRDLKPENVFLTAVDGAPEGSADRHAWLIDWGISKLYKAGSTSAITEANKVVGTPQYMSPEQLEGHDLDGRSDVYQLAVIIYEMTTGVRPYPETDNPVTLGRLQRSEQRRRDPRNALLPAGAHRPEIPEQWARVIARGLDPDPEVRWSTPGAFILALAAAVPPDAWSQNAIEVVRTYAVELTGVPVDAETAGTPQPTLKLEPVSTRASEAETKRHVMPPTVKVSTAQTVKVGPSVEQVTRASGPQTVKLDEPTNPTTLGGSTGTRSATGTLGRPRWIVPAAIAGAVSLAAIAALVATTGGSSSSKAATAIDAGSRAALPATSPPTMTAVAIVSEPDGATVYVDGVAKGAAPINVAVPAGSDVTLRAERVGFATATQTFHVGTEPATVRLQLAAIAADAGVVDAAPVASTPTSTTRAHSHHGHAPSAAAVGSASGSASASASGSASSVPFNPDDVP